MDFWKGLVRPSYHLLKAVNLMALLFHRRWHKASSSLLTCYLDVSFTYVSASRLWRNNGTKRFQGYQGQFTLPLAYQGVSKYAWQTVGQSTVFCSAFHCDIIIPRKCYIPRYGCYRRQSIQPRLDQGPLHQLRRGSWWTSLVDTERKGCLGKYVFTRLILGQCQPALLVFVFCYWAIGSFRTIHLIYKLY